jgi:hypothetical protein
MLASVVGILWWDEFRPRLWRGENAGAVVQMITAMLVALPFALVPITNTASLEARWSRQRKLRDPALPRRPVPLAVIVVLAAEIPLALPLCFHVFTKQAAEVGIRTVPVEGIVRTGILFVGALMAVGYLMRIIHEHRQRARFILPLYLFLAWLGPLMFDLARYNAEAREEGPVLTSISGCSPIGGLIHLWAGQGHRADPDAVSTNLGIVFNLLLAGAMVALFLLTRRRHEDVPVAKPLVRADHAAV